MARILYRISNSTADIPAVTSIKGAPLTNREVDGNFKSIEVELLNRAPVNNALLTGTARAPTLPATDVSDRIATTQHVTFKLAALVVGTTQIANFSVTADKIADLNVLSRHIANNAIIGTKIAPLSVQTVHLGDQSVSQVKLGLSAVQASNIADGAVVASKMAVNSVSTAALINESVTASKLGLNSVVTHAINDQAVTLAKIAPNTVLPLHGGTMTGRLTAAPIATTIGIAATVGGSANLEVGNINNGSAIISFHRHGHYAEHFGLDSDNQWKVGGWSAGARADRIWHQRNSASVRAYATVRHDGHVWGSRGIGGVTIVTPGHYRIHLSPGVFSGTNYIPLVSVLLHTIGTVSARIEGIIASSFDVVTYTTQYPLWHSPPANSPSNFIVAIFSDIVP